MKRFLFSLAVILGLANFVVGQDGLTPYYAEAAQAIMNMTWRRHNYILGWQNCVYHQQASAGQLGAVQADQNFPKLQGAQADRDRARLSNDLGSLISIEQEFNTSDQDASKWMNYSMACFARGNYWGTCRMAASARQCLANAEAAVKADNQTLADLDAVIVDFRALLNAVPRGGN